MKLNFLKPVWKSLLIPAIGKLINYLKKHPAGTGFETETPADSTRRTLLIGMVIVLFLAVLACVFFPQLSDRLPVIWENFTALLDLLLTKF